MNRFLTPIERLKQLHFPLIATISLLSLIGFITLYSAANGALTPWVLPQIFRFIFGFFVMIAIAMTPLQWWFSHAYLFYGASLFLLGLVVLIGKVGGGAQSWLDLYLFKVQPSELIKISLVLVLARYFHKRHSDDIFKLTHLIFPLTLLLVPAFFVMKQPDFGTMSMIVLLGIGLFFLAGVPWKYFLALGGTILACAPIVWSFILKPYQQSRILIFLDPAQDPKGRGYQILQSKIAIGSGGFLGKGFLKGTQGYLNFLPEKQTDFIFTLFSEEFGLLGSLILISLYSYLIFLGIRIALENKTKFGQLISLGVTLTFFIYFAINICMVLGLVPVVGVPLPFISYGGSSLITLMMGIGLLLNCHMNAQDKISKYREYR